MPKDAIFNIASMTKPIGVILLMQVLPFYDERAMDVLQGFEELVYRHLH